MPEEAERLWQEARFADPSNAEALFNSLLYGYRNGTCDYHEAQDYLGQISKVNDQGYVYSAWLGLEHGPEGYDLAARIAAAQGDPALVEDLKRTDREGSFTSPYVLSRTVDILKLEVREARYEERARMIRDRLDAGEDCEAAVLMAESINPSSGFTGCIYRPEWMKMNDRLARRGFPYYMRVAFPLLTVRDTQFTDPISFSGDSGLFLCGGRLYDMHTGRLLADHRIPGQKAVFSTLSPDGTFLLRADENGRGFEKIDARTGSVLERFEGYSAPVRNLAMSPDGAAFAGVDRDGVMRLWVHGVKILRCHCGEGLIRNFRIGQDYMKAVYSLDDRIHILRLDDGTDETADIHPDHLLNFAVNTRFDRLTACCDREGYVFYDPVNRKTIRHDTHENAPIRVLNAVTACFLPNDRYIAYSSIGEIYAFCPEQYGWILGFMAAHCIVTDIAFSRNWQYMAFSGNDGMVRVMRCAYIYYVPPEAGTGAEARRQYRERFSAALSTDGRGAQRDDLIRSFEEAFSSRKTAAVFAAVRQAANPGRSPEELLPDMMRELQERGFGSMPESEVLDILKNIRE